MEIFSSYEEGVHCLRIEGSFDVTDMPVFAAKVDEAIEVHRFKVLVNLHDSTFVGSRGMGALITAQSLLLARGGDLAVSDLGRFAATVFRTLGMEHRIRRFDTDEEAIAFLNSE